MTVAGASATAAFAATGGVDGWALIVALARVTPLVVLAPLVGGLPLPRSAQAALALVVAAVAAGGLASAGALVAAASWGERALLLAHEVAIGATLGVVAAVPLAAAAAAGAWAVAGTSDEAGTGAWALAFPLLAATVFFALGGHLAMVGALGLSYRALPAVAGVGGLDGVGAVVAAGAHLFAAGVALAAPLLVAALLATLLVGAVERVAGLGVELVPEVAVRRVVVVLVMAAAALAIGLAVAGHTRALPAALDAVLARVG